MEKSFLTEAFKQLQILDEEDYQLNNDEDIVDMKNTLFNDLDDDSIDVIDPEAHSEDELSDSYVGKVILDCEVCHSKIYKNSEDIVIDEESQLANIEDECPYCMSNDGYKIIGEVAPFDEVSEEDELEIDEEPFEDTKDNVSESLLKESGEWEYDPDIFPGNEDYEKFMKIYRKLHRNPNAKLTPEEKRILDIYKNFEDEHAIGVSGSADEYIDKIKDKVKEHNKFLYSIQKKLADGKKYANLTQEEKRFLSRNSYNINYDTIYDRDNRMVIDTFEHTGKNGEYGPILDPNYNYLGKYVSSIKSDKYDPRYAHYVNWSNDRDINTGKKSDDNDFYHYNKSHRTFQDNERAYDAGEMHDKSSARFMDYKQPSAYEISKENERHQAKIDELTNSYNQKVKELQLDSENSGVDNSKKLNTLEKRYNSYIARANKQHEDNINKIYADFDDWVKEIKSNHKDKYLAHRAERQQAKNNINSSDDVSESLLKESMSMDFEDIVLDSYKHFTDDAGRIPSISDMMNDLINWYDVEEYGYSDDTHEETNKFYYAIRSILIDNQLEFDEDEELSETFGGKLIGSVAGSLAGHAVGGPIGAMAGSTVGKIAGDAISDHKLKKDIKDIKTTTGIAEELEKIEVNTDNEVITVDQDENNTNINIAKNDVIAPISDETEMIINDANSDAQAEDEFDEVPEDEYVDYDIDEFDEESFDDLGESYLKNVYENVNSFKTSNVSVKGNTLTVEGIIKFNSGKEKTTQFIFESNNSKNNKLTFIGENTQISRGKKSFTLSGILKENKFIAESLRYNYRAKLQEGKSQRVYGRVKHNLTEATHTHPDLSKVEGSITKLLVDNIRKFDNCKSVAEITKILAKLLDDAGINTKASNDLLKRVSNAKTVIAALDVIYNSVLAGENNNVKP